MKLLKLLIIFMIPLSLFAWKMESGTVTLPATTSGSSIWQSIDLNQTYDVTPLIFAFVNEGSGYSGDTPVILRVRNITTTNFDMVQVESDSVTETISQQGPHPSVIVHYIAIEPGDVTLLDGTHIVAGLHSTTTKQGKNTTGTRTWDTVSFSTAFTATPVLLTQVQSLNNESGTLPGAVSIPWMTTTLRNINTADFQVALERAETSTGSISVAEDIGYLAIDSAKQGSIIDNNCSSLLYETILTSDSVRGWQNGCYSFNFVNTYTVSPNVIGQQETRGGGDGGWLRRCSLSASAVGITVDEDQSADSERRHTTEIAGLVVFEKDFVYDSLLSDSCGLQVNFQMDECYWLGGANGVTDDVKDSSGNVLDGQSRNKADNTSSIFQICRAGDFNNTYADQTLSDAVFYPNETVSENDVGKTAPFTVSAWVYRHNDNTWMAAVIKVSDDSWTDGWGLEHRSGSGSNIDFFVNDYNTYARATLSTDTWTHIVGTYDGSTIRIYKNGALAGSTAQTTYVPATLAVVIGDDISGSSIDDRWQGALDEVKIWNRVLTDTEINTIYNRESSGTNFDGTTRVCKACNGTSITGGTWDLIGIPADNRATSLTVNDVFGDDMNGTFDTDWKIYKRTYSSVDNSSSYAALALTDNLEFGQGYWLGSKLDSEWYVQGTTAVDYNSTNPNCTSVSGCVEIDLRAVTHDFAVDPNDGTGPYRYNMSGFTGIQKAVNWADCRFLIDGTSYTPTDANLSGFANKQIWMYNGTGTDRSNSYNTCDDTMACKLVPFKGFWIELHGSTKAKTVKLLIPKE